MRQGRPSSERRIRTRGPLATTVLVVDDERSLTGVITRALADHQPYGMLCIVAESHASALDAIASNERIHGLFLDVFLPSGPGLTLLDPFLARFPDVPTVVMTGGYQDASIANSAFAKGSRFLAKPFALTDLHIFLRDVQAARWGVSSSLVPRLSELAIRHGRQRKPSNGSPACPCLALDSSSWSALRSSVAILAEHRRRPRRSDRKRRLRTREGAHATDSGHHTTSMLWRRLIGLTEVIAIVFVNTVVLAYESTLTPLARARFNIHYGVVPDVMVDTWRHFAGEFPRWDLAPLFLPLVTGNYLHADVEHIVGNTLFLWVFANALVLVVGRALLVPSTKPPTRVVSRPVRHAL